MENRKCRVNLVGIGMGSKGTLTEEVRKIIAESDVLIGAMRMLEGFREKKKCCYAEYLPERRRMMAEWADYLDTLRDNAGLEQMKSL